MLRKTASVVLGLTLLLGTTGIFAEDVANPNVIEIDSPGILDEPGKTYLLTEDITVERTAFMIKGDNITLDLGGHTVTYGTAVGVDRCSGVFLRPAGSEGPFKGVPKEGFGGGNNFTLKNGRIVQGPQPIATGLKMSAGRIKKATGPAPGLSCFAVYVRGCSGLEITGITSEVNSRDTDNFYIRYCADVHVHRNHCISTVREVTDRHYPGSGVITVAGVGGPMDIHDNVIDGGGQWGIRVAGGGFTGHLVQVHHNIVRHRTWTTNGYGIGAHAANMRVYANVVKPVGGRGVHLTGTSIDFYNNIVDVREFPNPEYPRPRAHGIKLEGCRYTQVHHNFSRATAEEGAGDASPLDFSVGTLSANRIYKNTVVGLRKPNAGDFWATSLNLYSTQAKSLTHVHDNVFKSNHWLLRGDWGGFRGFEFSNNRFETIQPSSAQPFCYLWQSTAARSRNMVFRDSVLAGGADLKKLRLLYAQTPEAGVDVRVEWTIRLKVVDPAGKGIAGVAISALEGEAEVANAATGKEGTASVALLDFRLVGDASNPVREHGPYDLVLTQNGQELKRMSVDPKKTTELEVEVADPARKLYAYAGAHQRRKIGEKASLEGIVKLVGQDGDPEVLWKQVRGPKQLKIINADSPKAEVVMGAFGGYTFELEAKHGGEVAKHQTYIRADAQLTPTAVAIALEAAKVNTIVQLDGSKSKDPRGFPKAQIGYLWKQVEGPEADMSSSEWPTPIFYPTEPGTYVFELTVSNPIRTSKPVQCRVNVVADEE